jgi:hypothetical protein
VGDESQSGGENACPSQVSFITKHVIHTSLLTKAVDKFDTGVLFESPEELAEPEVWTKVRNLLNASEEEFGPLPKISPCIN